MRKYEGKEATLAIFESVMAVFYVVLGFALFFWDKAAVILPNQPIRIIIGVLFVLYGCFRIYRSIKKFF